MASISSCCTTGAGNRPVSSVANVLPGGRRAGPAQPGDPALASRLGFGLEHFEQHRQRVVVPGLRQPRNELLGRRRQAELFQQRRQPVLGGVIRARLRPTARRTATDPDGVCAPRARSGRAVAPRPGRWRSRPAESHPDTASTASAPAAGRRYRPPDCGTTSDCHTSANGSLPRGHVRRALAVDGNARSASGAPSARPSRPPPRLPPAG